MNNPNINNNALNQLDIFGLIGALWNKKFFLITTTSIITLASILIALILPNIYTSSSVLKLSEDKTNVSSSPLGSIGGLASVAGVDMSSGEVNRIDELFARLGSRDFLKHILTFEDVLVNLTAAKGFDSETGKILYDEDIYKNGKWIGKSKKFKSSIPTYLETQEYYNEYVDFHENKLTGLIIISVNHYSPQFAADFLRLIITEANNVSREVEIERSEESINYLSSYSNEVVNKDVKLAINQLMFAQMKDLMIANVKEDYVLEIIDEPFYPEKRSSPKRTQFVITGFLLGLMLSILIILIRKLYVLKSN